MDKEQWGYNTHEFSIIDSKAHDSWERLAGFEIKSDKILITHEYYLNNIGKIHAIQFASALRLKI